MDVHITRYELSNIHLYMLDIDMVLPRVTCVVLNSKVTLDSIYKKTLTLTELYASH